jgi:hypothetical protein
VSELPTEDFEQVPDIPRGSVHVIMNLTLPDWINTTKLFFVVADGRRGRIRKCLSLEIFSSLIAIMAGAHSLTSLARIRLAAKILEREKHTSLF